MANYKADTFKDPNGPWYVWHKIRTVLCGDKAVSAWGITCKAKDQDDAQRIAAAMESDANDFAARY